MDSKKESIGIINELGYTSLEIAAVGKLRSAG